MEISDGSTTAVNYKNVFSLITAALLFKFIGPALKRFNINAPNLNRRLYSISFISYKTFIVIAQPFRLYNAKTFSSRPTQAYLVSTNEYCPLQLHSSGGATHKTIKCMKLTVSAINCYVIDVLCLSFYFIFLFT